MDVFLVNQSTAVSDRDAFNIAWALSYQGVYQFGRAGWPVSRCYFSPGGANALIPAGGSVLHLLDTSDQPGALGYHDEAGNEVPFARVFVKDSIANGDTVSEVASHEFMEMIVDPHVNLSALHDAEKRLYAYEVGDPCQGNSYDVGQPQGRITGVTVADFVLPNYFDPNTAASAATDYRGALKGPFALGPQGYYSYIDMTNPAAGWVQKTGSERTKPAPPEADDRVGRR